MARIKSAVKNIRKSRKRRDVNRARRSALRSQIKKMRRLLDKKNGAEARKSLPTALSTIDRAVSKGVLHRNAAARHKSRLVRHVTALEKAS